MKAWQVTRLGEPEDVLAWTEIPDLLVPEGSVRVKVEAVALNFPDVLLCRGEYQDKPELPFTPGGEVCGRIVGGPRDGKRVLAAPELPHGGLAEEVVVPAAGVFAIPEEMPAAKAASMLITYQTGYVGLHTRARLQPGEWLLVHAGAGGVGSAAIQIAKAAGAHVIATAGGADKAQICRDLGADVVVDYTADDFVPVVKDVTQGRGADVIYDSVGGDVFDKSRRCVAFEGRIVVVGFAGGRIADAPTNHALIKNYSVVGLYWGLYRLRRPKVIGQTHESLMDLWRTGQVDPLVSQVLPMGAAPTALAGLGDRRTVGKVVLENAR